MKLIDGKSLVLAVMSVLNPLSANPDNLPFEFSSDTLPLITAFNTASMSAPKFQPHLWIASENFETEIDNLIQSQPQLFAAFINSIGDLNIGAMANTLKKKSTADLADELSFTEEDINIFIHNFDMAFSHRQKRSNCYSYAVNDLHGEEHYAGGLPFPGENTIYKGLDNGFASISPYTLEHAVIQGAKADGLDAAGETLPETKFGYYRVALMVNGEDDFHWVREDQSGLWSGKWGHQEIHTTDNNNTSITNPDYADFGPYEVVQYFYVPEGGINLQTDIKPPYIPGSPFERKL